MSKRKYAVGDKVWIKASRGQLSSGEWVRVPRQKAVVVEVVPIDPSWPTVETFRVRNVDDGRLTYHTHNYLVRRFR